MPWLYNEITFSEDITQYTGFVYLITNLTNSRKYIGKKTFFFKRGKKKKESDWKTYWSSSKELQNDVTSLGPENFKREILRLCKSKGEASYFEASFQFKADALLSNEYYNTWISCRIRKSHLKNLV